MLETGISVLTWRTTGSQFSVKADDNRKKSSLFSSSSRSKYQLANFFACSRPTAKRANLTLIKWKQRDNCYESLQFMLYIQFI